MLPLTSRTLRTSSMALLGALALSSGASATPTVYTNTLLQWAITSTTGATNTGSISQPLSGFTASQISAGPAFASGNSGSPSGAWNQTYTNNSAGYTNSSGVFVTNVTAAPSTGLNAVALGTDFLFDTYVSPRWSVTIDQVSGFFLSKTANAATYAGLYYSTNNGTTWLQAGGTANVGGNGSSVGNTDRSGNINTGAATNNSVTVTGGLNANQVTFNNLTGSSTLTVEWALAWWGGSTGRNGIQNGGNLLSLLGTSANNYLSDYWIGGASGTWDQTSQNWSNSASSSTNFLNLDYANFTNAADTTITVAAGGITANGLTNSGGNLTLGGGTLTVPAIVQKGTGTLTLNGVNVMSGGLSVNSGTVVANYAQTNFTYTTNTNTGIVTTNISYNSAVSGGVTMNGGTLQDNVGGSVTGPMSISGGTLEVTSASTETNIGSTIAIGASGATLQVDGTNTVTFTNSVTGAQNTLTLAGTGTLDFTKTIGVNKNGPFLDVNAATTVIFGNTSKTSTNDLAGGVISGTIVGGAGVIAIDPLNTNTTGSGTLSGTGTLVMNGGTLMSTYNSNPPYANMKSYVTLPIVLADGPLDTNNNPTVQTNTFNGSTGNNDLVVAGPVSGSGAILVSPSSSQCRTTMSGTNTFTGGYTVAISTLAVTGSNASAVTLSGVNANLSSAANATGTIGGLSMLNGGNVIVGGGAFNAGVGSAPTNTTSAGGLIINGGADFSNQTPGLYNTLILALDNSSTNTPNALVTNPTAGSNYSQMTVNGGTLNYGSAAMYIQLSNTNSAVNTNGFMTWPTNGAAYQLVQASSVTGDLSSVTFNDYEYTNNGSNNWVINTYTLTESNAGSGLWYGLQGSNTLAFSTVTGVLSVNGGSIPEPSTSALMGVALTALTLIVVRARRRA